MNVEYKTSEKKYIKFKCHGTCSEILEKERKNKELDYKKYLEAYARALTSRDAEKYAEAEDEVIDMETIINEVSLLRNKWLGVMKGIESKNFMLGHVVRLRTAGMEDIVV